MSAPLNAPHTAPAPPGRVTIGLWCAMAMLAFAANSVLCRMALSAPKIDPASFSSIRLLAGSLTLLAILWITQENTKGSTKGVRLLDSVHALSVAALAAYMLFFSFAYQSLSTGTGALLLFGAVQLTMIGAALANGQRLSGVAWLGLLCATAGLVYLVSPGVAAPHPGYAALMVVAGLAWGVYSLQGKRSTNPTRSTTSNFVYATPIALLVSALTFDNVQLTPMGALLAVASGAIASAMGYALWYATLRHITSATAAVVQLSVPALATFGGVLTLGEPLTVQTLVATALTIGGIALFLTQPARASRQAIDR